MVLPLLFMTVTGLLLNRADELGLREKTLKWRWVMERYGFDFDQVVTGVELSSGQMVTQASDSIVYQSSIIAQSQDLLLAVAQLGDGHLCVATTSKVHYVSPQGELIESLDALSLPPGPIKAIGVMDGRYLVIEHGSEQSSEVSVFDESLLSFESLSQAKGIVWSPTSEQLLGSQKEQTLLVLMGHGMALDRVLLDLHTGKLFGKVGKFFVDLFGYGIIAVSITGVVLTIKKRNRKRQCEIDCGGCPSA